MPRDKNPPLLKDGGLCHSRVELGDMAVMTVHSDIWCGTTSWGLWSVGLQASGLLSRSPTPYD